MALDARPGHTVITNDLNPQHAAELHLDATQLGFWDLCRKQPEGIPGVVCSCWFKLLDLLAPLAAEYAEEIACLHIPPTFLTSATAARQAWIHELSRADRLLLVTGLSVGKLGRRCSWLVVSKQAGGWRQFLRHDHPQPAAWIPLNISRHQPGWGVQVHEGPGNGEATRELGATPRTSRGVATAVTPGEEE
ncbi:hypothetical protein RI054_18g84140 [Pseudoscourfieldia marina]